MKIKNILLALKDQLPFKRLLKNISNGNILGIFYKHSHINKTGTPKIGYRTKEKAILSAEKMKAKTGNHFSTYN